MSEGKRPNTGLHALLPALAGSSVLGYGIQFAIPLVTEAETYVRFSAFWAALFLCVAGFTGVQQEVARSVRGAGSAAPPDVVTLRRFATFAVMFAVAVAAVVGVGLSLDAVPDESALVVLALAVGLAGYSVLAVLAGVLYGTRSWRGVAIVTLADPMLRGVFVVVMLVIAWSGGGTLSLPWLVVMAALPFPLAALLVWVLAARRAIRGFSLDSGVGGLVRNALHTVAASMSLGFIASGLPLIIGIFGAAEPAPVVAGIVFLVILARAPLVSPMLSLQSYLTVRFGTPGGVVGRQVVFFSAAILGVTVVGAGAVLALAPFIFDNLVEGYALPSMWLTATIVGSAGLVAVQCVTGPAVLARAQHRSYAAGWVATALLTVLPMLLPLPFEAKLVVALVAGPLAGITVHCIALRRPVPMSDAR